MGAHWAPLIIYVEVIMARRGFRLGRTKRRLVKRLRSVKRKIRTARFKARARRIGYRM